MRCRSTAAPSPRCAPGSAAQLAARDLDAGKLDVPAPYAMPDHVLALGARYSLDELGDAFAALAAWFANAHAALGAVQQASRGARS